MSEPATLAVENGPDKPALRLALAYPDEKDVRFSAGEDAFTARLSEVAEQPDGVTFRLAGTVSSGGNKDRQFDGSYNIESKSGTLNLRS